MPTRRSPARPRPATACCVNSDFLDGMAVDAAKAGSDRPRRGRRLGRGQDRLAAARLGRLAPALLGHADPVHPLRRVRRGAGAEGPAAGRAARGRRHLGARQPAGAPSDLEARPLPELRRRGDARDRHARHLRRQLVVFPALRQPAGRQAVRPGGGRQAGCRSTSTSAASSTRSCTCSTPASGPARCSASASST